MPSVSGWNRLHSALIKCEVEREISCYCISLQYYNLAPNEVKILHATDLVLRITLGLLEGTGYATSHPAAPH